MCLCRRERGNRSICNSIVTGTGGGGGGGGGGGDHYR